MKCSVKKFRGRAKVNVLFWIFRFVKRFVEGENTSEERHSFVMRDESHGKKRQFIVSSSIVHVQCCRLAVVVSFVSSVDVKDED